MQARPDQPKLKTPIWFRMGISYCGRNSDQGFVRSGLIGITRNDLCGSGRPENIGTAACAAKLGRTRSPAFPVSARACSRADKSSQRLGVFCLFGPINI